MSSAITEERRRLHTTIKGDLAKGYAEIQGLTDLDEPELLRQGLIRLINEVKQQGQLVAAKLTSSADRA